MKRVIAFFATLLIINAVVSQNDDTQSEYHKQYEKLYKAYVKSPDNVANKLAMAEFYSAAGNPMRDYATAMTFATDAEQQYIAMVEDRDKYKEVSKLIKKKITVVYVRSLKHNIILETRRYIDSCPELSDAELDALSKAFKTDGSTMRLIDSKRLMTRYRQTQRANTLEAYRQFLASYSATQEGEDAAKEMSMLAYAKVADATTERAVDSTLKDYMDMEPVRSAAMKRKSAIAYAKLMSHPTPQGYRDFISKYPGSDEYSSVIEKMEPMLKEEFGRLERPRELADFALNNPDNPLADQALEKLKSLITNERDMEAYRIYMEEFPLDVNYNDIYLQYFNWHTEEGNLSPIAKFAESNPDFPYKMALDDALAAATRYDSIDINMAFNEKQFKEWASKIYHLTGKNESYVGLQRTLQGLLASKDWKKALARIDHFAICFEDNCAKEVSELREMLSRPTDNRLKSTPTVRPAYDMMHPVANNADGMMYFNRTVEGHTSIYVASHTATKKGGVWKSMGMVEFSNMENRDVQIYSFYAGGNKMLLGHGGDILTARRAEGGWELEYALPKPINSDYNDFDAYMLPDSSGILLASDRPGGQNLQPSRSYFHGDTALASDLYFVPITERGVGEAINLGINVNTPYMESSPMMSKDMKTLYFVSDGHGGLGYGDLYFTTRDNTEDWRHWTSAKNAGKELNSGLNESSVAPGFKDGELMLCSNQHGRYGCYTITDPNLYSEDFAEVTVVSESVGYTFDIIEIKGGQTVTSHQSLGRETKWQSAFYRGKEYLLTAHCDGLFSPSMRFRAGETGVLTPTFYDESGLLKMSSGGAVLWLEGMIFENKRATLSELSTAEIEHLAKFVEQNEDIYIELVSHYDGSDDGFSFNLSEARAQEIKKRLTAKGIDPDRIAISAYGNSRTKLGEARTSIGIMVHLL